MVQCCWQCNVYVLSELCKEPSNKIFFYIFDLNHIFHNLILLKFCITSTFLMRKNYSCIFRAVHNQGQGNRLKTFFHVFDWNHTCITKQFCFKFSKKLIVDDCILDIFPGSFKKQRQKSCSVFPNLIEITYLSE